MKGGIKQDGWKRHQEHAKVEVASTYARIVGALFRD